MEFIRKNISLIGKVLFVIIVLYVLVSELQKSNDIQGDKMYTIATVNRVSVNANNGESVYYTYFIGDSLFVAKDIVYIKEYDFTLQNIIGVRLLMKFEKSEPHNSKLIPNIRIGNNVKAPIMGLKTIIGGEEGRRVIYDLQ